MRTIKIPNSSQMVGKWGHSLLDCYLCLDQNNTINNPWKFVISWTQIYVCKSLGCSVKIPKKSSHRVPHAISYERNKTPNISDDPCLPPVFVIDLRLEPLTIFLNVDFQGLRLPLPFFSTTRSTPGKAWPSAVFVRIAALHYSRVVPCPEMILWSLPMVFSGDLDSSPPNSSS